VHRSGAGPLPRSLHGIDVTRALPALLALAYLATAQAAVFMASDTLALIAGMILALLVLLPGLLRLRIAALLCLVLVAAALMWLHGRALAHLPLYLPPILLNLFLAWLFGHTLAAGRVPLVERMVRAIGAHPEPLADTVVRYARQVTLAWTLFFIAMALLNLLLAMLAVPHGLLSAFGVTPPLVVPQTTWSLFANLLNYLLVGVFFVAEFAWRRRVLGPLPYRGFGDFLGRLARVGPTVWRDAR
jgi:uncharacterized membrane protein